MGKQFKVITDQKALLSRFKYENHSINGFQLQTICEYKNISNKLYNSRLTRWVDRLLKYQFTVKHMPGVKMGLIDYVSRHPNQKAKQKSRPTTMNSLLPEINKYTPLQTP